MEIAVKNILFDKEYIKKRRTLNNKEQLAKNFLLTTAVFITACI